MKRIIKIGFPVLCVAVIGGTFYLLNKTLDKVNSVSEEESKVSEITDETTNTTSDKKTNTTSVTTTISYDEIIEQENKESENKIKAKELAGKKDGTRSEKVYYTNEGKDEDNYIVAVRSEETTEAIIYYSVDVENEVVEIYY